MKMKMTHDSTQDNPVKALLSAAYGPGTISAQLLAVFFTQYFAVTALDRKLRAQGKLSKRVGQEQRGYARALSALAHSALAVGPTKMVISMHTPNMTAPMVAHPPVTLEQTRSRSSAPGFRTTAWRPLVQP